jgi:hypothetical protein
MYDSYVDSLKNYFNNECDFSEFNINDTNAKVKAINILQSMHDVYEAKDSDYSENDLPMGNLRESIELGIQPWKGVLLRIGDKKRRIGSFISKESYKVKDEAVEDTLIDMANYSLLGAALFMENNSTSFFKASWIDMAKFCILTKLSYEEDKNAWKTDLWPQVNIQYRQLASKARVS